MGAQWWGRRPLIATIDGFVAGEEMLNAFEGGAISSRAGPIRCSRSSLRMMQMPWHADRRMTERRWIRRESETWTSY